MQFKDVLLSRHSVRYFEATPVAEAILRDIIDCLLYTSPSPRDTR